MTVDFGQLAAEFGRLAAARRIAAAPSATGSLAVDRVNAERWVRRFGSVLDPGDGASTERTGSSVLIRPEREDPAAPHVLYVHGGGMVYYSAALFEPFLRTLATELRAPVEAFDYLKAPEHAVERSVAQLGQDVAARCRALAGRPLVLAGDSVGGLLALYLAVRLLPGTFARTVLIYPVLDLRAERESYRAYGEGYFLDAAAMRRFKAVLAPFFAARDFDPFGLSAADLGRLPACSVVTAGCDVLRDEGLAWVDHLAERSVPVHHRHFDHLPHDFCLYGGRLAAARNAVAEIARTAFGTREGTGHGRG